MDRRKFILTSSAGTLGLLASSCGGSKAIPATTSSQTLPKETKAMTIKLPPLPYELLDLEPHISAENLDLHYNKHHNAYVTNLNKLIEDGKADGKMSLEEIIMSSPEGGVFNNAAQIWNHTFYWQCIKPKGGGKPSGDLALAIKQDFGSFETFREQFINASVTQFASGWGWLVSKDGKLLVTQTSNADLPMKHGQTALLTCDVWEHAYYPTYKNLRAKYVEVFFDELVNWDFVSQNFSQA